MASADVDDHGAQPRRGANGDSTADAAAATTQRPATSSRGRRIGVNVLIGVTTLLLVIAVFSVWANRLLFNPDNWSNTSTQLLNNADIRGTTANYLVDQLYANVDVNGVIRSGLPDRLQPLAAPVAGALRNAAVKGVDLALTRPRVQNLWAQANRAADQAFIAVVNGGKGAVRVNQGVVTLNLGTILDNVASRLGLPSGLSAKLPANVANLTILRSSQLKLVQDVGNTIKGLALWLTILTPLLYALAIFLARGRRRQTLMTVGFAIIVAGTLVLLGRSLLESQGTASLTNDASLRPTIKAVFAIGTGMLSEIAGACIVIGIPLILAAWFAGPARAARAGRETIAPFLREHPGESYAITLGIMVLIFIWNPIPATGKIAGMIVFLALAMLGTYVLSRQTATEFPEAKQGATADRLRAHMGTMRETRRQQKRPAAPAAAQATIPEQLQQLVEMRDHGTITADEYQSAKAQLLNT